MISKTAPYTNVLHYFIVVQPSENGYCAYAPDVPGCIAAEETIEAVLALMAEALEFHCEGMMEHGELIPEARGMRFYIDSDEWNFMPDDILTHVAVHVPEIA